MPTLFQILKDKIAGKPQPKPPAGPQIYNPINAKIGCAVTIDELDYRGNNFFVKEIHELDVAMGGKSFKTADYVLHANPLEGDPVDVRLRVCPAEASAAGLPFRALVLSLYDQLEYNEGLHNVVRDDSKKFIVDDSATGAHEEYWRCNDVGISYPTKITAVPFGSAKDMEYWDYSRMTKIDGVEVEQFVFVEMEKETGYFQIWRGSEINPEQVMVL